MGIYDYENMKAHKIKYKNGRESNLLERTKENITYIIHFAKYLVPGTVGRLLNTHVFKYTRLRDEIYAVTCRLYDIQDKDAKDAKEGVTYTFFVNEKSFWNRFHIFDKNGLMMTARSGISIGDMLNTCEHYKHEIDRITLNLIPEEQDDLAKSITSIQDEAEKLNIYDSSIVVIDSHINYNKRVWCELLEQELINPNDPRKIPLNTELGSYKTPDTVLHYDPKHQDYAKYAMLYE